MAVIPWKEGCFAVEGWRDNKDGSTGNAPRCSAPSIPSCKHNWPVNNNRKKYSKFRNSLESRKEVTGYEHGTETTTTS